MAGHSIKDALVRGNRELKKRERQKSNRFISVKQQLCTCITLLYTSLPLQHDYNMKVPNFTLCRGREHKTTTFFFFS